MTQGFCLQSTFNPTMAGRTLFRFEGSQCFSASGAGQALSFAFPFARRLELVDLIDRNRLQEKQSPPDLLPESARQTNELRPIPRATTVAEHLNRAQPALEHLSRQGERIRRRRQFDQESDWLARNRHKYVGRWIGLDGDTLLAVGDTAKDVFAATADHNPAPLVVQIVQEELPFAGW